MGLLMACCIAWLEIVEFVDETLYEAIHKKTVKRNVSLYYLLL